MKTCTYCHMVKPLSAFSRDGVRFGAHGATARYKSRCRDCTNLLQRQGRQGCIACGASLSGHHLRQFCDSCWPPVCVCPQPDTDNWGMCLTCSKGYTPGLMETRRVWIEYLESRGVACG